MNNYLQDGDVIELTAPAGGVNSGTAYLIGGLVVVAQHTAAAGDAFQGYRRGVFTLPIASGDTPTEGQLAYWDNTNNEFTVTETNNTKAGVFVKDNGSDAVLLAGIV